MANPFSHFNTTSPLSSISHNPSISLASNVIRDFFGPMVQMVADGLQARGGASTIGQILHVIHTKSDRKAMTGIRSNKSRTKERNEIIRVSQLQTASSRNGPSVSTVKAALLVLIQHSIVTVQKSTTGDSKRKVVYTYQFDPDRARIIVRYPRFIEYTKKALDETAAALVEELLIHGRMQTVDAIVSTVEQIQSSSNTSSSSRFTQRQAVLESFRRLVAGGFIEQVSEMSEQSDDDEGENEFVFANSGEQPPQKKPRTMSSSSDTLDHLDTEDPAVVSLLQTGPYKQLPRDGIWRINVRMFHESLRALSLGWLVSERYANTIQSAGAIVTAALKLAAYRRFAPSQKEKSHDFDGLHTFLPEEMSRYLSKGLIQNFEKKPGGVVPNLYRALQELAACTQPQVIEEVEVTGDQAGQARFQVATAKIVGYMQDRIIHQIIRDSHGEVAARICTILGSNGFMESDNLAEAAMVTAKDTREILHRLYRDNLINLFNINQGKQHNPASMFYLWSISRSKTLRQTRDNVCTALLNMRLRRQHEVEVGKEWIERAKEAGATDENDNEMDKLNYTRFCQGLERLDTAAIQLDETLMVLRDY